jgi:hypothetical protein
MATTASAGIRSCKLKTFQSPQLRTRINRKIKYKY